MPSDIVTGQDARDVADYVAQCAKVPGQAPAEDEDADSDSPPTACRGA
jgi:hypothetical protein